MRSRGKFSVRSAYNSVQTLDREGYWGGFAEGERSSGNNRPIGCGRRNERSRCRETFCCRDEETPFHLLFQCEFAQFIWFGSPWGITIDNLKLDNMATFWERTIEKSLKLENL
ncbi:hypothetical protein Syun_007506 [Stephania yunnanensis]|uniref:Reverse transcriptase zinc-binding domain-containing protein n=1 Tax=Stephania yunnanensis TaxID=152371 RepID=A0AAP0KZM7_9MAGN